MPESNFIYEAGEPIVVGSHGDHEYVYASGTPVSDSGQSELVFESGVGLGGGALVVNGTNVGFFETSDTTAEFMAYTTNDLPNSRGWYEFGVHDTDRPLLFVFGHHSTSTGQYGIGWWMFEAGGVTSQNLSYDILWSDFGEIANNPSNPEAYDGEDHDCATTDANGDPVNGNGHGWFNGDGAMYNIGTGGVSHTFDIELHPFESLQSCTTRAAGVDKDPDGIRGVGPNGAADEVAFGGFGSTSVTVEVNV